MTKPRETAHPSHGELFDEEARYRCKKCEATEREAGTLEVPCPNVVVSRMELEQMERSLDEAMMVLARVLRETA